MSDGMLKDGMSTLISFAENPTIELEEIETTPPGIEGGGPIDISTMRNSEVRTNWPKKLKTVTPASVTVAYNPAIYASMLAMINVNQLITNTFSDGSTLAWWGYVDGFKPSSNKEGDRPTAELTVQPTNVNDAGEETLPVLVEA